METEFEDYQKGPNIGSYLLYAGLLSVLIILAMMFYQSLTIFEVEASLSEISKNLRDFVVVNYKFENGKYSVYLVPTSLVRIEEIRVNENEFEKFKGIKDVEDPIVLNGNASGEIMIFIKYQKTELEHIGYAIITES